MPIADTSCPVIEQIARVLFTRLKRLLDQSYHTKTQKVVRPIRLGQDWTPEHLMIVLTQGDEAVAEEHSKPGNPPGVAYVMRFNIRCFVVPSEKDPVSVDEYINFANADIRKAVVNADANWVHFNDANSSPLAITADWSARERLPADGGIDGVLVPLDVLYRVSEHNPYVTS